MPGDRVVCIDEYISGPEDIPSPPKGEVLTVDRVRGEDVGFKKYDHRSPELETWFSHWHFAPVQDATEMEEDIKEVELFLLVPEPF